MRPTVLEIRQFNKALEAMLDFVPSIHKECNDFMQGAIADLYPAVNSIELDVHINRSRNGHDMYGGTESYGVRSNLLRYLDDAQKPDQTHFSMHLPWEKRRTVNMVQGGIPGALISYCTILLSHEPDAILGGMYLDEIEHISFSFIDSDWLSPLYRNGTLNKARSFDKHYSEFKVDTEFHAPLETPYAARTGKINPFDL